MHDYKKVAIESARAASKVILEFSKHDIQYSMKSMRDIQAQADLAAENIIIANIKKYFPEHSILSEEAGAETKQSEFLWVIDPIDGTINFSRHIEEYCVSIALTFKGEIILGVIYQPETDKLYVAEKSKGAYLNGKKINVSTESELINCIMATDNSSKTESRQDNFDILSRICTSVRHVRIFGSCALHLGRLAEGQIDFYYKTNFNYWDFAAGIIIVQEAGGKVSDLEGNEVDENSTSLVAANTSIHDKVLDLIGRT
jgi:myo-inositol-1(or 4)-monophosphatase